MRGKGANQVEGSSGNQICTLSRACYSYVSLVLLGLVRTAYQSSDTRVSFVYWANKGRE